MKKLLLGLAVIIPAQLYAAEDSVYSWGAWADGIKPAAGPVANLAPAPAQKPQVNFRPNETSAFNRTNVLRLAPPAATGAPQEPTTVIIPSNLPVISPGSNLNSGSSL